MRRLAPVVALALALLGVVACDPDPPAPPLDLARPRILAHDADLDPVRERLDREPYRTLFAQLHSRAHGADAVSLDDHEIGSERVKAKAAKDLAFEYALDRTLEGDAAVPFTAEVRAATAERVQALLLAMYTRSRLAVPAPLGGSDRDINSSEELLQYATAYDTMLGAGYDFGAADATIRARLTDLAAELYLNYVDPSTASGYSIVLPNNHRSKSAAALGVAALALADTAPAEGAPATDPRDPGAWLAFALDQVDLVQRYTYAAPDGAYGEGTYYQRYAGQNLLPFARAWNGARGGRTWDVGGRAIPDLWTDPGYRATQRWLLDHTLPDGSLAPIDDGNVGFAYYFGLAPGTPSERAEYAWRWANAPVPYDADGSVDLAADALVAFDDALTPRPPAGSPTRLHPEGGTAVLRSDWSPEATTAIVLGEHGAAAELGRDRDGLGRIASAAHEQPDTGSFLLHAFGERLVLDPGYLTYPERGLVGQATDHNLVLVNGEGPGDPFTASIFWSSDLAGPPPVDGQATISAARDTPFVDAARVTSAYAGAQLDRRVRLVDDRYLVVTDTVAAPTGSALTWLLHGNGGGTSGGTFTQTAAGGRWERPLARVDTGFASSTGAVTLSIRDANHEAAGRVLLTHTALEASVTATGGPTRTVTVVYPTRAGEPAPTVVSLPPAADGSARVRVTDLAGDRLVTATHHVDGRVTVRDAHADGSPRLRVRDRARKVGTSNEPTLQSPTGAADLALRIAPDAVDVAGPPAWLAVDRLPFSPTRADGACELHPAGTAALVLPGRDGTVTLRPGGASSAPAADPGPDVADAPVGGHVRLDGRGSCDLEGEALTPRWDLVAAPQGSSWALGNPDAWSPVLLLDRPGPYRVRLVVTDASGAASRPVELEVYAGPRCVGDRLDWSDPRCSQV